MKSLRLFRLIAALLFCTVPVYADYCSGEGTWVEVERGLLGPGYASLVYKGDLYIVHDLTMTSKGGIGLSVWNGSSFRLLSKFKLLDYDRVSPLTLVEYNGELYMGGDFTSLDSVPNTGGVVRWDGKGWESTGAPATVEAMAVFDGILYAAYPPEKGFTRLLRYDRNSWQSAAVEYEGMIFDLKVYRNNLYASGNIRKISSPDHSENVVMLEGSAWVPVGADMKDDQVGFSREIRLAVYREKLYALGRFMLAGESDLSTMAFYDGAAWQPVTVPGEGWLQAGTVFRGRLYLTGTAPREEGSQDRHVALWAMEGEDFVRLKGFNDWCYYPRLTEYRNDLFAMGDFISSCGVPLDYIARFCDEGICGEISGTVYRDVDGDCVRDTSEPLLQNRMIRIRPGRGYAITDDRGRYTIYPSKEGISSLELVPLEHWKQSCPVGPYDPGSSGTLQFSDGFDFSSLPLPDVSDLFVTIAGGVPRPGFQHTYTIRYKNVGTVPVSGTLRLEYDPLLVYESSTVDPARISSGRLEWDFNKLAVGAHGDIRVYMRVPADAARGSVVCASVAVDLHGGHEEVLRDNTDELCEEIRGSYDPNDITVSPLGDPDDELSRLSDADTVLSYMIRFQNTGNDTAFTVVVVDTVDLDRLDLETLRLGASSHPYDLTIEGEGVLRFTFRNILLPDSNVNEVASHGYLKYTINLLDGLPADAEVWNRAFIYFDYNAPVETNTVVSITGGTSSAVDLPPARRGLRIYPNPTTGTVLVDGELPEGTSVTLSTMLGEEAGRWLSDGSGRTAIDISTLPAGLYILRVWTQQGPAVERLNLVR